MSRWNDEVTLVSSPEPYQDEVGSWHSGEAQESTVFCNRYAVSLSQNATALDLGLRDTVQVQVRTVDYSDQDQAIYRGKTYEISYVSCHGDNTTLTLGHKIGDE